MHRMSAGRCAPRPMRPMRPLRPLRPPRPMRPLHVMAVAAAIGIAAIGPAATAFAAGAAATVGEVAGAGKRAAPVPRRYEATGRVVSITPGFATVAHDEIPGFMTPMTMEFELASRALALGIRPGQRIRFTLRVVDADMVITALTPLGGVADGPPAGVKAR